MLGSIAASSSSSGSNPFVAFIPLILMGGIFYFILIRPQQRRARAQAALVNAVEVGDEVMTTSGMFATVTDIDDDENVVELEIAPGTRIRMVRSGISRRLVDEEYEDEDEPEDEDQDQQSS